MHHLPSAIRRPTRWTAALRRRRSPLGRGAGRGRDRRSLRLPPRRRAGPHRSHVRPSERGLLGGPRGDAAGPPVGGVGVRAIQPRAWARSAGSGSTPAVRGQGVARALMAGVEDAARELGLADLRLGTGDRQPEAVALYAVLRLGAGPRRRRRPPGARRPYLVHEGADVVTTEGASFRIDLRNRAGDHAGPDPRAAPDRRAEPGRHQFPHPRQPHRPGHRLERGRGARGAADGRAFHRLPQRPRPQPARLPARPPDRGRLRRGPVPLRLRRRAAGRGAHERAQRSDDAGRGPGLRRDARRAVAWWPARSGRHAGGHRCASARPAGCGPCRRGSRRPTSSSCRSASHSTTSWPGGPASRWTCPSTPGSS